MPYSPNNITDLPKNVQEMDEKSRKQWCHIWNQTYEKYGDEEKAFKYANGVLKKEGEQPNQEEKEIIEEIVGKNLGLNVELKEFLGEIISEIGDDDLKRWLAE